MDLAQGAHEKTLVHEDLGREKVEVRNPGGPAALWTRFTTNQLGPNKLTSEMQYKTDDGLAIWSKGWAIPEALI